MKSRAMKINLRKQMILFFLVLSILSVAEGQTGRAFYVSSSTGDDENEGSIAAPFKSLDKISSLELFPSDTVFFMRGDRFDGHLTIPGSGTEESPLVFTAYGDGEKPVLSGEVGSAGGGDFQEAVFAENKDCLVFDGLEIRNERKVSRLGVSDIDAYGMYFLNSGTRVLKNFTFRNMTFRKVYAVQEMNDPEDFNSLEVAGLRLESAKNTVEGMEKNIRDVLVEDCYFTDLQRLGVHLKHLGAAAGIGNDSINKNMNLVFRNNEFHYTGGTCILPSRTYNCLIENNVFNHPGADTDPRMPGRGSSVWTWNCVNTVIQHNQCLHIRGYLDSHGVHIDHNNVNTIIQYNFMKDCEGGFVEILGGNLNSVYRFNISVNDGWRNNPNWINSNHTFWINDKVGDIISYSDSSYIYNNTLYIDSTYSTAIDITAKNTYLYNNIIVALNGAYIGGKQVVLDPVGEEMFISNNLYMGLVASSFKSEDRNPVIGSPDMLAPADYEADGFRLNASSIAENAGIAKQGPAFPVAGTGIFKDISTYATTDFFGNPVNMDAETPNIGACNAKSTGVGVSHSSLLHNGCIVYPNPADGSLFLELLSMEAEVVDISVFDVQGRVVQQINGLHGINRSLFGFELSTGIRDGIYILQANTGSDYLSRSFILERD